MWYNLTHVTTKASNAFFPQSSQPLLLFVDTNYCYHRGGLILEPGLTRNLITITYGGITHELNDYFKSKVFSKKNFINKFVARSLRFARKKLLEFKGGVRQIPIVLD